jgi:hypothetical protein
MISEAQQQEFDRKGIFKIQTKWLCPFWLVSSFMRVCQPLASALIFGFTVSFTLPKIKLIYLVYSILNSAIGIQLNSNI